MGRALLLPRSRAAYGADGADGADGAEARGARDHAGAHALLRQSRWWRLWLVAAPLQLLCAGVCTPSLRIPFLRTPSLRAPSLCTPRTYTPCCMPCPCFQASFALWGVAGALLTQLLTSFCPALLARRHVERRRSGQAPLGPCRGPPGLTSPPWPSQGGAPDCGVIRHRLWAALHTAQGRRRAPQCPPRGWGAARRPTPRRPPPSLSAPHAPHSPLDEQAHGSSLTGGTLQPHVPETAALGAQAVTMGIQAVTSCTQAHGPLLTPDVLACVLLHASLWAWWRLLHVSSPLSLGAAAVASGLLLCCGPVAWLLPPAAALLGFVRLTSSELAQRVDTQKKGALL